MPSLEQGRQSLELPSQSTRAQDDLREGAHSSRGAVASRRRVAGVDLARGVALFGMMATHVVETVTETGPTAAHLASGRSAGTFALIAGVSVAFLSGGRLGVRGRARKAAAAGLAVRALLIGAIGLLLGFTDSVNVILAYYAVLFLVAIPLLGLAPRTLALLGAILLGVGPVLLVVAARLGVEFSDDNPTLVTLVTDPIWQLGQLVVFGWYPVVVYLPYLCVGLALGRLDLTSRRLAGWLFAGGVALALTARLVSAVLLYPLGGLDRLLAVAAAEDHDAPTATELLLEPEQGSSWWYLALSSPHAHTPLDVAHTLGSAMAVLGACLLLTRLRGVERLLQPVAAAGAMTLTLYSAQILVLHTGILEDYSVALLLLLVAASLAFAVVWRSRRGQGPLERLVTAAAVQARSAVLAGGARRAAPRSPTRQG